MTNGERGKWRGGRVYYNFTRNCKERERESERERDQSKACPSTVPLRCILNQISAKSGSRAGSHVRFEHSSTPDTSSRPLTRMSQLLWGFYIEFSCSMSSGRMSIVRGPISFFAYISDRLIALTLQKMPKYQGPSRHIKAVHHVHRIDHLAKCGFRHR